MNVFFDVDHTLVDGDDRLRPGARDALASLSDAGHDIYLWSGLGPRWEIVEKHDLGEWVNDCFEKPLYRHREMLVAMGIEIQPDFVIDDHADPVGIFGGVVVEPYRREDPKDKEMQRVVLAIQEHQTDSRSRPTS